MTCCTQLLTVVAELSRAAQQVDGAQVEALAEEILRAKRVFVAGAGRSGLCVRAFANRLMHLGICVYVVGETVTPPLTKDDLLLIGSGSGKTSGPCGACRKSGRDWRVPCDGNACTAKPNRGALPGESGVAGYDKVACRRSAAGGFHPADGFAL